MTYQFSLAIAAPVLGVMMMSPIDAGSLNATQAERYVCSGGKHAYTVMADPKDPGPAMLSGYAGGEAETTLFKRSENPSRLRYESEGVRFHGVVDDMVLEIGSAKLDCRQVRKSVRQTVAALQTSEPQDGASVNPAAHSVGVVLRGGPHIFSPPGGSSTDTPG